MADGVPIGTGPPALESKPRDRAVEYELTIEMVMAPPPVPPPLDPPPLGAGVVAGGCTVALPPLARLWAAVEDVVEELVVVVEGLVAGELAVMILVTAVEAAAVIIVVAVAGIPGAVKVCPFSTCSTTVTTGCPPFCHQGP